MKRFSGLKEDFICNYISSTVEKGREHKEEGGKEKERKKSKCDNVNIWGIWIKIIGNSLYCSFTISISLKLCENKKVKEKNKTE